MPPCDLSHGDAACWGYAQARAFGHTTDHNICPADQVDVNEIQLDFFDVMPYDSSAVQRHDIIGWESSSDCSTSGHVAYVRSAGCSSESCIRVDQVDGVGGAEELNLEIDEVDGHEDPECIYRLKRQWKARFTNSFGSGAITVSGEADNQAPVDKTSMAWNAWVSVAAVDEQSFNSTLWYFHHWEDAFGDSVSANLNTSLQMGHRDIDAFGSYTAVFERRFPVGFENAFSDPAVDGEGTMAIQVGGGTETTHALPHTAQAGELSGVTVRALNQTLNGISYDFDQWSDGVTTRERTIYPTGTESYTAEFTGVPTNVTGQQFVGAVGEPIQIEWDEHPNPHVEYKIWRYVKDVSDWTVIATVAHGTTSYTDQAYSRTASYTHNLLSYDVRAYYTIEQTSQSSVSGSGIYGRIYFKNGSSRDSTGLPLTLSEFRLNHFPNPVTDTAVIEYLLAETGPVQLSLYDVAGRRIRTLVDHVQGAGPQAARWDGTTDTGEPAGNGVYLLRLQTSHGAATHKVVLLR